MFSTVYLHIKILITILYKFPESLPGQLLNAKENFSNRLSNVSKLELLLIKQGETPHYLI